MHIAVCDDNIADRKQMERLLERASDRRIHTTGVLYIDSYGNVDAVMRSPMLYDAFFIDMTSGPVNGFQLARKLIDAGSTAPIILCISTINYRAIIDAALAEVPDNAPATARADSWRPACLSRPCRYTGQGPRSRPAGRGPPCWGRP